MLLSSSEAIEEIQEYEVSNVLGNIVYKSGGGFDADSYYFDVPIYRIYHFVDHDIYIRFIGYMTSYDGCIFARMEQVYPSTQTVTIYDTKQ